MQNLHIEQASSQDQEFLRRVKAAAGPQIDRCYQCYTCSNSCPIAYALDYFPNQLLHMVRLGLKEKVLRSKTIWLCVSCETCATRCPNEINLVRLMDVLRRESLKAEVEIGVNEVFQFHRLFIKEIQKRGRIFELPFLMRYKLKMGGHLSVKSIYKDGVLGFKMLFKGKFKVLHNKFERQKEIKDICRKILSES